MGYKSPEMSQEKATTPAVRYFLRRKFEMERSTPFPKWREKIRKIVKEIEEKLVL